MSSDRHMLPKGRTKSLWRVVGLKTMPLEPQMCHEFNQAIEIGDERSSNSKMHIGVRFSSHRKLPKMVDLLL